MFLMLLNTKFGVVRLLCSRSMGRECSSMQNDFIYFPSSLQDSGGPGQTMPTGDEQSGFPSVHAFYMTELSLSNLDLLTWSPGLFLWWILVLAFICWLSVGVHLTESRCFFSFYPLFFKNLIHSFGGRWPTFEFWRYCHSHSPLSPHQILTEETVTAGWGPWERTPTRKHQAHKCKSQVFCSFCA